MKNMNKKIAIVSLKNFFTRKLSINRFPSGPLHILKMRTHRYLNLEGKKKVSYSIKIAFFHGKSLAFVGKNFL